MTPWHDTMAFSILNAFSLSLLDQVSHLELQIRHKVIKFATTSITAVHVDVYHKIMKALSMVCDQLNFSFQRVQAGFFCQCGKLFEPHIAILPPFTTGSLLYATCSVNTLNQLQLTSSHFVWFNESTASKFGKAAMHLVLNMYIIIFTYVRMCYL